MKPRHLLWAGLTGLSVPFIVPVAAQTPSHHATTKKHLINTPQPLKTRAHTQHLARKSLSGGYETLSVHTRHLTQGTQLVLGHKQLEQQVPGTNPLRTLAQLPGVQFQSDDPQGIDTYSTQLYMHGFVQSEIGMTLDGLPLGEPTFRNYNGLNPLQAISSENVERLEVTQSAGAESTASTNNLGGKPELHLQQSEG
ncbi:TonB-dependent receptor plug domain-containing protein [Bombella sp. ESL0378]|uniref:TonB-dependent receptor plug domain-containing protein n=1 Tax=Bombella sp. ESL0378 TaxID=2676442 RepID=UPI001E417A14|nr:Plug domain-containing protein [Bombella sp. ESL0378]